MVLLSPKDARKTNPDEGQEILKTYTNSIGMKFILIPTFPAGEFMMGSNEYPWESGVDSSRVYRGGSWRYHARCCRSTNRFRIAPNSRYNLIGFRLLRELHSRSAEQSKNITDQKL